MNIRSKIFLFNDGFYDYSKRLIAQKYDKKTQRDALDCRLKLGHLGMKVFRRPGGMSEATNRPDYLKRLKKEEGETNLPEFV